VPSSELLTPALVNITVLNPDGAVSGAQVFTVSNPLPTLTSINPTPGGGTSNAQVFTIYPIPTLTSISPSTKTIGSATFTMTLTGTSFASGAVAYWGADPLTTTFGSATSLTATVPASEMLATGNINVTVVNLGGGTTGAKVFALTNPAPTITTISPSSAILGDGNTPLVVTGTGFVGASVVWFGSTALTTTYVSATEVDATIPSAQLLTAQTVNVTVVNPTPGGGTSAAKTFTVNNPVPTLTSISPTNKPAGSAGFTLTLTGTNFISSSTVKWGSTSLVTTFGSGTSLTAAVPASLVSAAGTANVTVVNATPGGGTTAAQVFTINPLPVLSTISPTS
jgi:hypothetical protein